MSRIKSSRTWAEQQKVKQPRGGAAGGDGWEEGAGWQNGDVRRDTDIQGLSTLCFCENKTKKKWTLALYSSTVYNTSAILKDTVHLALT